MCPQDLRARVIGIHPLLGKIQTAHQIFNVISGGGGEQASNAIGRSGFGDRAEGLCAWLVEGMTLRPVDVNVNQPWRNQPPFGIKLIQARIDIFYRNQPGNPTTGHKQRLSRHHLIRQHQLTINNCIFAGKHVIYSMCFIGRMQRCK